MLAPAGEWRRELGDGGNARWEAWDLSSRRRLLTGSAQICQAVFEHVDASFRMATLAGDEGVPVASLFFARGHGQHLCAWWKWVAAVRKVAMDCTSGVTPFVDRGSA